MAKRKRNKRQAKQAPQHELSKERRPKTREETSREIRPEDLANLPQPLLFQLTEMVYIRSVVILAGLGFFFYLLYYLRSILTPILLALLLAYLINPVVIYLEKGGASRQFAIITLVMFIMLVWVTMVVFMLPAFTSSLDQLITLLSKLPSQIIKWKVWLQKVLHITFPKTWTEALMQWGGQLKLYAPKMIKPLSLAVATLFSSGMNILIALFNFILIPLFTFYFLKDYNEIKENFYSLIPIRRREYYLDILHEIDRMLSGFVRGQLTVSFLVGSLYLLLLGSLDVPLAALIAVIGAVLNVIPYLGFLATYFLAIFITLIDWQTSTQFWGVVFGMGAIHLTDVFFITPKVVGDKVGLSELVVIFAVLAGGQLFGLIGIFLAIPFAAISKVLLRELLDLYRKSDFYGADQQDSSSS